MTIILGLLLSFLMGAALGLLGGGGSILAVPILVFVLGMAAKPALATSLLVVAVTSAVAAAQHARAGHLWLRVAAMVGPAAMLGAFGGARFAAVVPEPVLLGLFAVAMGLAGATMLRPRVRLRPAGRGLAPAALAAAGLGVGALTGLLGAGGGFLLVPLLVRLGGLPMHAAVGTSLAVIALNATAGLAGYLTHVDLDAPVAGAVTAAAAAGALVAARLAVRVPAAALRRAFGACVIAVAVIMLWSQAPAGVLAHPYAQALLGGALVGLAAAALLLVNGRIAGVSGIVGGILRPSRHDVAWRVAFVAGLVAAGTALGAWRPGTLGAPPAQPLAAFALAGLLVGAGARIGGGCTSGHGVCGVGRGSARSIAATTTFVAAAAVVVFLVRHVLGGMS